MLQAMAEEKEQTEKRLAEVESQNETLAATLKEQRQAPHVDTGSQQTELAEGQSLPNMKEIVDADEMERQQQDEQQQEAPVSQEAQDAHQQLAAAQEKATALEGELAAAEERLQVSAILFVVYESNRQLRKCTAMSMWVTFSCFSGQGTRDSRSGKQSIASGGPGLDTGNCVA